MKTFINKSFVLPVVVAALGSVLDRPVTAQTFMVLHSFSASVTNSLDGNGPQAGLIVSGNTLYGTTSGGGSGGDGTVFAVNSNGSGFTVLHAFTGGSDGTGLQAGLILSGNKLYGTTERGGTSGAGTVFALNTDGTGFTTLHSFEAGAYSIWFLEVVTNSEGVSPSSLTLSDGTLYGTTSRGGSSGGGTVFKVNTDGTGFTTLYTFTATFFSFWPPFTNSDGVGPTGLVLSSNTLYGTTSGGGSGGDGTVFAVNTDGTGFRTLYKFTASSTGNTNSDGSYPQNNLLLLGNTLYGTTLWGGSTGNGTVFAINTDGTGFRTLYNFTGGSDARYPHSLISLGSTLCGTANSGGSADDGTLFAVKTDGTDFTTVHGFAALDPNTGTNSDGAFPNPFTGLELSGNILYGTTSGGGTGGGTVYSISFRPQLTLTTTGPSLVLSWPTNFSGFNLQSTTNLGPSSIWTTNLPAPVVINGQYTVTNPISGTQQFFRLSQ